MAGSTRKTAAKKKAAPRKTATAKAVEDQVKEPQAPAPQNLVAPMHPDAFRLAMSIVNSADIKGGDAETIVLLKRELARVSGGQTGGQPRS